MNPALTQQMQAARALELSTLTRQHPAEYADRTPGHRWSSALRRRRAAAATRPRPAL
jgi:hypothetical protein